MSTGSTANAMPAARAVPENCDRTYTVVTGDYCNRISELENVSTWVHPACRRLFSYWLTVLA